LAFTIEKCRIHFTLHLSRQRKAIVDGLRDSVLHFSQSVPGTTPKDVMDLVLVTQYVRQIILSPFISLTNAFQFDTVKDLGHHSKNTTLFVPHAPGSVAEVASEIRSGFMTVPNPHTD
jgi:hypothetical protein